MKSLIFSLLVLLILLCSACGLKPLPFDEERWRAQVEAQKVEGLYAPHVEDGRYFNPWMPQDGGKFSRLLRWRLSRREGYSNGEEEYRPGFVAGLKGRIASAEGDFITWIGHGTFLMRINGVYWLTDPMLSDRALLPKRKTPPALTAEELAGMGAEVNVIISHNHYDHLDKATIRRLPVHGRTFVPLGLKTYVEGLGRTSVTEMDWWEEIDLGNGVRIVCLPAQHWSRRISQGTNRTLWASFLLVTPSVSVYYGGDSGYFIGYREMGRKYPGIDYALLPVTAYHPRWFMHYAHVDAKEALDAFRDLNARYFIPTQWGTFRLGDEPIGYGVLDLRAKMKEMEVDPSKVLIMDLGEILPLRGKGSKRQDQRERSFLVPGANNGTEGEKR